MARNQRVPYRKMDDEVVKIIVDKYFGKAALAFVEYRDTKELFGLAVCVFNEEGYSPVPIQLACGTHQDMREDAAKLNRKFFELDEIESAKIVASTMSFSKKPGHRRAVSAVT